MTKENQHIAIAEANGLFRLKPLRRTTRKGDESSSGVVLWYCDSHPWDGPEYSKVPNYTEDLNAMHRVELKLPADKRDIYMDFLAKIVEKQCRSARTYWLAINATAAERAEAFLKTFNLWEE